MQKDHIQLSAEDKSHLQSLLSSGSLKVRTFKRATALLELDQGKTITAVCQTLSVSYPTLLSWKQKYLKDGLSFLQDKPRPGRPKDIDGALRAKITALACSEPPEGHTRWSLRLLADKIVELSYCDSISHTEVGRILKKTNSSPT